ncbi:putative tail tape measure protein [Bacillus phage vB_BcM_Sam46]|uniref:Putative tail tape measure protein n=2 Tax=Caudoviricetes TaxID=2731619 RepID=A0A6G9L6Z3_9CAUD|nr:putative tail tape measure protein [Bacillus phage vB_BcM_Sam112]QIQ61217.1 putative tail tape measure protein [Bacillus phage vB_BcM_Sam46]
MSALRELVVAIDFDEIDVGALTRVDSAMDAIENELQSMDRLINDVGSEFNQMGAEGAAAGNVIHGVFNSVANSADEAGDEIQGATAEIIEFAAAGSAAGEVMDNAFDGVERDVDGIANEVNQASAAMAGAAAAATVSGAAMDRAFEGANDDIEELIRDVGHLGRELVGAAAKAALLGTALTGAVGMASAATAPLLAATMGLVSSMGAAAIGAGAYGAVAVSVLGQVFESATQVDQIQQKIDSADSAKERIAAQKELAALYDGMSESQRNALTQLQEFKSFWGDFTKQFEEPIFSAFNQGLQVAQGMLQGLAPTISNVSGVVNNLLGELNGLISGGGMNGFFEWLSTTASDSLYNWAHIFGNTFSGIFGLLQAFTPLGQQMEQGLLGITEKFSNWANTLSSNPAFQNFVEYVQTNGPVLWDTLGNIANIFGDIIKAAAPLGEVVLAAFEGITQSISDITPGLTDVVQTMIDAGTSIKDNWEPISAILLGAAGAVLAFKTMTMGLTIIQGINALMIAWRAGTVMQTLAMWGLNASLLANPLTWIAIAIGAVIAIGVLLYQNWDTIKAKAGELWTWISEVWSSLVEWTKTTWNEMTTAIGEAWDAAVEWVTTGVQSMIEGISQWWNQLVADATMMWNLLVITIQMILSTIVSWVVTKAMEIWTGLTFIWDMVVLGATTAWNLLVTTVTTVFSMLWTGIVTIATSIWTGLVAIFTAIQTTAVTIWTAIVTAISTIFSLVWNFIVTTATAIWTTISTVFNAILQTAISIWTAVSSAIQTFFTMAWNFVVQIATSIWNTIVEKFNAVLQTAQSIWTAVTSAIQSAFRSAVDIVIQIAMSIYNTIKEKFDSILSTAKDIWNGVKTTISDAMNSAKDAVSNFFEPLFGWIDKAKGLWSGFTSAISNFKMPSFSFPSLPSWMPGGGADGSHKTGLSRVPFDGYKAVLHKDEAVLTAKQSDALRAAGVLDNAGSKPRVSMGTDVAPTGKAQSSSVVFSPSVKVEVNGGNGDSREIARQAAIAARKELEAMFDNLGLNW